MLITAELFANFLKEKNLHCFTQDLPDDQTVLSFPYDGKQVNFFFNNVGGEYVSLSTVYESIPAEKVSDMIIICNQLNTKFRWLKFYVDHDNDLMLQIDAILTTDTAAATCFELLGRQVAICKEAKPLIMRAIYA